jgi:hypothetical protein
MITGELAFKLHDTHGFPIEMTYLERPVDMKGFCEVALKAGWKPKRLSALLAEGWLSKEDAEIVKSFV